MTSFSRLPQFEKELKKLARKYPSIQADIADVESVVLRDPQGIGKNFTIIHQAEGVLVVKVRVQCESLRSRAIRLVYAYHSGTIEFVHIEVYFKGDKENEDRGRIEEYLKNKTLPTR